MKLFFVLLFLSVSYSLAERIRYDNYKLYRLIPKDEETLNILKQWEETDEFSEFNFWSPVVKVGVPVDIMVPPHCVDDIKNIVRSRGINSSVMMENVQDYIDNESLRPEIMADRFTWTSYHTYDEYRAFLHTLTSMYSHTSILTAGISFEGRQILGVRVSFSPDNQNRTIFLESLIHAREWITGAVSTYILHEILTNTDPAFRSIVERYDWYVFPIVNPDGFEYSYTTDRMWRKTRVPYSDSCFGADPNRNWGYHWNSGGASTLPCSETYTGPNAFSEPSTRALSEFISYISDSLIAYISFHSYSQLLLLPYGYTSDHLDNYNFTYEIGLKAAESLAKRYGTNYTVGNMVETLYPASGCSMDWVKGTFGTPLVYTYELRDRAQFGFLLPAEQIIPTALETIDSLVTILKEYERKRYD